jgi:hypothetical protein
MKLIWHAERQKRPALSLNGLQRRLRAFPTALLRAFGATGPDAAQDAAGTSHSPPPFQRQSVGQCGPMHKSTSKEDQMFIRFLAASALTALLVPPAFAACEDEISNLDQAVVTAETGAQTGETAPATEHQGQVMGAEKKADTADVGGVEATSPHQRQAVGEIPDQDRTKATTLLAEARDSAEAGDEHGCMEKLAEAKKLLGMEE